MQAPALRRLLAEPPGRVAAEALARALGCHCPETVFDQVRIRDLSDGETVIGVEMGGRLLIALMPAAGAPDATGVLARGRALRDRDGLNRFRLVLVGDVGDAVRQDLVGEAERLDDRMHVHTLAAAELATLLAL